MSWPVFFAAPIPAIRATCRTSPFVPSPDRINSSVAGSHRTTASAVADRRVTGFSATSTIRAAPDSSKWVRGKERLKGES